MKRQASCVLGFVGLYVRKHVREDAEDSHLVWTGAKAVFLHLRYLAFFELVNDMVSLLFLAHATKIDEKIMIDLHNVSLGKKACITWIFVCSASSQKRSIGQEGELKCLCFHLIIYM